MPEIDFYKLLSLIFVHMIAVASPGPDFMIVIKQSIQEGRKSGVLTSAGIGLGLFLHCIFSLTALTSILHFFPAFLSVMKILSAFYLLYLAFGCFKSTTQKNEIDIKKTSRHPFLIGLITNGTNPKVIVYISATFTYIAGQYHTSVLLCFSFYLALQTFAWFTIVSYLFCHNKTRQIYLNHQKKIDITMGLLLIYIAIRLLYTSF